MLCAVYSLRKPVNIKLLIFMCFTYPLHKLENKAQPPSKQMQIILAYLQNCNLQKHTFPTTSTEVPIMNYFNEAGKVPAFSFPFLIYFELHHSSRPKNGPVANNLKLYVLHMPFRLHI